MSPATVKLLDRVADRTPVAGHDGRSGARIERGRLDDGTPVFVKHADVEHDIGLLLTGSAHRERDLFDAGVFERLPHGVATALIGVEDIGGVLVSVTRDVSHAILTWDRRLTEAELDTVLARIAAVHTTFVSDTPPDLCELEARLNLFGRRQLDALAVANPQLHAAVLRGWELFADLVPVDLSEAVRRTQADPGPLARALGKAGATMLHGDFWLVNLALDGDVLIPLDWGLATLGPPAVDLITFCAGAMSNVAVGRDALVDRARQSCGAFADDDVFAAAEFWALMGKLGWNKALDSIDHPDPAKRRTEAADLEFWVGRARGALDAGCVS